MYKSLEQGRSMIEMLGVLAIIAVLSVGGIAGYSKAMSAYKLDKWYNNLTQVIMNLQTAYINQKSYSDKEENLTSMLVAAGVIPQGILDSNYKDILGNRLTISSLLGPVNTGLRININHQLLAGKDAVACCKKIYEIPKYYPAAWAVAITDFKYVVCGKAAPKKYSDYHKCQPYDLAKVYKKCSECKTKSCSINFILDNSSF